MATLVYQDYQGSSANSSSYTFSSMGIGTADVNRKVLVCIGSVAPQDLLPTSVSVGGISASLIVSQIESPDGVANLAIFEATVPTGTTADVVVGFANSQNTVTCVTYSANGLNMTPTDSDGEGGISSSSITATVTRSNGGFVLAGVLAISASDIDWTGVSEDLAPQNPEASILFSVASLSSINDSSLDAVSTFTASISREVIIAVSFPEIVPGSGNALSMCNF
jgi:hypothetical protein